jgi:CheY-like chemotaxis protein
MKRVLICDDEPIVHKVARVAFEPYAVEVVNARDGLQAMELLRGGASFDLIITDIHMPHHNGDDILRLVREEQKKNTPIVMLSSDGEEEVIKLALKSGVNDFIVKPVDATRLIKKVKQYLE